MPLVISHTREAGSLLEGAPHAEGIAVALRRRGWRWSRAIGCWFLPFSRGRAARSAVIDSTAARLRAAGFCVSVCVDGLPVEEVRS